MNVATMLHLRHDTRIHKYESSDHANNWVSMKTDDQEIDITIFTPTPQAAEALRLALEGCRE